MFDLIHETNELTLANPFVAPRSHPDLAVNDATPTSKVFPLLSIASGPPVRRVFKV